MKIIVVPTDFSSCALNALKVAADIARKSDSVIKLVHVYERPVYGHMNYTINNDINRSMLSKINELICQLAESEFLKGIRLKKTVLTDIAVWEMVNNEHVEDADLIIMGSHGATGWKEYLIGSNTEKVARIAKCPVLTIKRPIENFNPQNIVFASDFSGIGAHRTFFHVLKIASIFKSKIHLLRINTPKNFESNKKSTQKIMEFITEFNITDYSINIYNYFSIKEGIIHFTDSINADLIALATYGRTGLAHIINGSIAEDVLNHAPKPVLSYNLDVNSMLERLKHHEFTKQDAEIPCTD